MLPDVDEALREAEPKVKHKLKLIAWVDSLDQETQDWIWSVFEKGYINGTTDCATAWRVVEKHVPGAPQIGHQSMKRGVDAHFARR